MNKRPYTIAEDGKSITCHICGKTSHNMNDVANCYCGHCHAFYEIGLNSHRNFIDSVASAIAPLIGKRDYILLVLQPGAKAEGESGNHVSAVTNLSTPEVHDLLNQFIAHIAPEENSK